MKKSIAIIFIVVVVLLSSILTLMVYKNYNNKIDIQLSNQAWNSYDDSIEAIKSNMDSITVPNENFFWWSLKDFDIEDDEYEKVLNLLVADVRMCYLDYTDDGTLYTNSNPIRNYRDKKFITKEELKELNLLMYYEARQGCLERFERYDAILISNDETLKNKVLEQTNEVFRIKSTALFTNQKATYNELLLRKTMEVHLIEDISEFLVWEYKRLK